MAKIKILFLTICILTRLSWLNDSSNHLNTLNGQNIVQIAQSQIGVRELNGKNDGQAVEEFLRYTGLPKGHPWCAAFVSWVYSKAGFTAPKNPWSPALFPQNKLTKLIKPGFVYGLYDKQKRRIVHCGIATRKDSDFVLGIEGNTNSTGSIEGDGVYLKRRHALTIHAIADWISTKGGENAN